MGDSFEQPFPSHRAGTAERTRHDAAPVAGGATFWRSVHGTDPSLPVIVLSAHYDHLGIRDGRIYPGADDNASGVATLLEIARVCVAQPFRHGLVIAALDAEEGGLQGARAFMAGPPVPKDRIALNVNLDMVARGDKGEIYVAGTPSQPDAEAAPRAGGRPRAHQGAVRPRSAGQRR